MSLEVVHRIEKTGSLYFLLDAAIGAYNRRTDALVAAEKDLAKWVAILAQAIAGGSDQQTVDDLAAQIKREREAIQAAVDKKE